MPNVAQFVLPRLREILRCVYCRNFTEKPTCMFQCSHLVCAECAAKFVSTEPLPRILNEQTYTCPGCSTIDSASGGGSYLKPVLDGIFDLYQELKNFGECTVCREVVKLEEVWCCEECDMHGCLLCLTHRLGCRHDSDRFTIIEALQRRKVKLNDLEQNIEEVSASVQSLEDQVQEAFRRELFSHQQLEHFLCPINGINDDLKMVKEDMRTIANFLECEHSLLEYWGKVTIGLAKTKTDVGAISNSVGQGCLNFEKWSQQGVQLSQQMEELSLTEGDLMDQQEIGSGSDGN